MFVTRFLKSQFTTVIQRHISCWEHKTVLDNLKKGLNQASEMMKERRETVEHPFGTLKLWMGYTHFQMKTLKQVSVELNLHVLAFNLKRVLILSLDDQQVLECKTGRSG